MEAILITFILSIIIALADIHEAPNFSIRIENVLSRCLHLNANDNNNVYMDGCNFRSSQLWRKGEADSDGYYTIINEYNDECLAVDPDDNDDYDKYKNDGKVNRGDNIYTSPCRGTDNQLWRLDTDFIRNKANGRSRCLDYGTNKRKAHIWSCDGGNNPNQKVKFVQVTKIESIQDINRCIDLDIDDTKTLGDLIGIDGDSDYTNAYMNVCNDDKSQFWRKGETDSNGYYTLISEHNGQCLAVDNSLAKDFDFIPPNIGSHKCNGESNQLWQFDGLEIKNKDNGKCVNLEFDGTGNDVFINSCKPPGSRKLIQYGSWFELDGFTYQYEPFV